MDLISEQRLNPRPPILPESTLVLTYEHASPGSSTTRLHMMILMQEKKFCCPVFSVDGTRLNHVLFQYFLFISTSCVTSLTVLVFFPL